MNELLHLLHQYRFTAFPEFSWYSAANTELFINILLLFGLSSLCYLALAFLTARFLPNRRQRITVYLSSIYSIGGIIMVFHVSSHSASIPFAPTYQVVALLLLNLLLIVSLMGSWFTSNQETENPLNLFCYLRAHYWFALLSLSLLILVLLIQVPIVDPEKQLFFFAPMSLALLIYALISWFLNYHSWQLLGMKQNQVELPDSLQTGFAELNQVAREQGGYKLELLKAGFRNAVALYPQGKILFGIDLLHYLTPMECRAILLHEIGHLQDEKYIPMRQRIGLFLPVLFILYLIADQGNLFPSFAFETGAFFLGLIFFSFLFKRLRLKGEYVADTFVKEFPGEFHPHLISGLKRLTRLNGMDEDFCKTHNYSHLDVDERERMVREGQFSLQRRKPARRFFVVMLFSLVAGLAGIVVWNMFFPSGEIDQWRQLHSRYHDESRTGKTEQAAASIRQALDFSMKHFGEVHNRTYISLHHLADISLRQEQLPEAEEYALRTVATGEQLYGSNDLHRVKDQWLVAELRVAQGRKDEAEQIYNSLLSLQQGLNDDGWRIGSTLFSLSKLVDEAQAMTYYRQIIELYKNEPTGSDNGPGEWIFNSIADAYVAVNKVKEADDLFQEGIQMVKGKKGVKSSEYGYTLDDFSIFLMTRGELERAAEICSTGWPELPLETSVSCLYSLSDAAQDTEKPGQAAKYLNQALALEEQLYGKNAPELIYGLDKLMGIAVKRGNAAEAVALKERIQAITAKIE